MKTLFLVYDKNYIYFPEFHCEKIELDTMWKDEKYQYCFLTKVFRKLHIPCAVWFPFFAGEWIKKLDNIDKIVIFDAVYEPCIGHWIKKKKRPTYIYMWDGKNRERLSGKQIFPVLSFNPKDTARGMLYQQGYYYKDYVRDVKCSEQYDVFYCARLKNREEQIRKICTFFNDNGFSTYFHLVADQEDCWDGKIKIQTKELSYRENIMLSAKSRAILNIVNQEEKGTITLRCLEAMYLKKKLITNDTEVKKFDFFNENNIFIIDDDKNCETQLEELRKFMGLPYYELPQKILDQYDMNNAVFGEEPEA